MDSLPKHPSYQLHKTTYTPDENDSNDPFAEFPSTNIEVDLDGIDLELLFATPKDTTELPLPSFDVPLPQRKNYVTNLINNGFTPTVCYPNSKKAAYDKWQITYFQEVKEEFLAKMQTDLFQYNFGILTGLPKYRNVTNVDFDIKQFVESEQQYLIPLVEDLIKTDYIQTLVRDKKVYIEKSVSNGFHIVVSIADSKERSGNKILDYEGTKKANLKIPEIHYAKGEFLESQGKGRHFVSYPSNGYTRLYNVLWELKSVTTEEYDQLLKYIMDYFLNLSEKFSKADSSSNQIDNGSKSKTKSQVNNDHSNLDKDQKELLSYQKKFAETEKDIEVLKHLLNENGYKFIDTDGYFLNYVHPMSSQMDTNFSVDVRNHCITNFSTNNNDFPNDNPEKDFAVYGSLRACFILWKKLNPDSDLSKFYDYLKNEHDITLIRDVNEIMRTARQKFAEEHDDTDGESFYTLDFVNSGPQYYQLVFVDNICEFNPQNLSQIYNQLDVFDEKEKFAVKYDLDKNQKMILNSVKQNYIYSIDKPEMPYILTTKRNQVDLFVTSQLPKKDKDNDLWRWYIKDRFKSFEDFGNQWISAFSFYSKYEYDYNQTHTHPLNAKRLSSLILTGDRKTGKGTFHEYIRDIFGLSHYAELDNQILNTNFDSWKLAKYGFCDEAEINFDDLKKLYNVLKKSGGNTYVSVEQKFKNRVNVKNQLSFIIASNNDTPFFTEFSEMPEDKNTNQFFVHDFTKSDVWNDSIKSALRASFFNYIITDLREIFYDVVVPTYEKEDVRWVVKTPITQRQLNLFDSSLTKNDSIMIKILEELYDQTDSEKFVSDELLTKYVEKYKLGEHVILGMIRSNVDSA